MSSSLPPEIYDLIVDDLHDEPTTLKKCSVVSKSWVSRARKHLFVHVEFHASKFHVELWKKTFPDPSNSPAHHTRTLSIYGVPATTLAYVGAGDWIRSFNNVVHLRVERLDQASLVPFHGLSATVRSLRLTYTTTEIFPFICSFPLLKDLAVVGIHYENGIGGWNTPLTSPKLTGSLDLRLMGTIRTIVHRLLDLPGGLHFSDITVLFSYQDTDSVMDLVSGCVDTLEFLTLIYLPLSEFPSAPASDQYLTLTRRQICV